VRNGFTSGVTEIKLMYSDTKTNKTNSSGTSCKFRFPIPQS